MYYQDDYIDYWGHIYTANNFIYQKITFECFLNYPQEIIDAIKFIGDGVLIDDGVFYPLMPQQLKIQQQTDAAILAESIADDMDAKFERNGHVIAMQGDKTIERFHHHDTPKKWKTNGRRVI